MISPWSDHPSRRPGTLPALLLLGALASTLASACELLPQGLAAAARAIPSREWVLYRDGDGQLVSALTDHLRGRTSTVQTLGLERGDHTAFEMRPAFQSGVAVNAGDAVGTRRSALAERRCAELRGELDSELAYLELARSGDKAPVIREAEARLDRARAEAEQQERELARQRSLFDRSLVAPADLELAEATAQVANLEIRIAEQQLATARAGSREQEIAWIETRVTDLRRQLELAEDEVSRGTVCCPISGRFSSGHGDTLAIVRDTSSWAAVMPVNWADHRRLEPGLAIEIQWNNGLAPSSGALHRLGADLHTALDGRQFIAAVARLDDVDGDLAPGLVGQGHIDCPSPGWLARLRGALSL